MIEPQYETVNENTKQLLERFRSETPPPPINVAGHYWGGDNDGMEARVKALEDAVKNLPTKADLDGLRQATKADLEGLRQATKADLTEMRLSAQADASALRADMHKNSVDIQRWMIATVIGLFLGFGGLFLAMSNALKPSAPTVAQPSQQAPIIINVPASSSGDEKENGRAKEPPSAQQ